MNEFSRKDLNLLLGSLTDLWYFVFMCISFFFWNITILFFLFYRLFKTEEYKQFLNYIKTDEVFSFRKKIDIEPLHDEDDDWQEYYIHEEFKEESIEVENILKWLQKKQLEWTNPSKSNILRYIYWGMESSLLWYILWTFATINWMININFTENTYYTLFTTLIMIWLFFFYNSIFEKIFWIKSQFELIDKKIFEIIKKASNKIQLENSTSKLISKDN